MTNSKHTKRALLSSALALLLCFTMLLGTTFAWFTDTASTSVNTIQAGTLDVVLEMYENGNWVSAEGKTLEFKKAAAASGDEKVLWEPGCTYTLPDLRIRNNGNLALKYKVVISGINGDAKLNEVIEWTIGEDDLNEAIGTEHYLLAGETSDTFAISGHMMETAGNEYQGLQITGIAITVYATQYTHEYDSNNNQYDKDATYSAIVTPNDLRTAIANAKDGDTIVLASDIVLDEILVIDKELTLNLNGHTITTDKDAEEYGWTKGNWSIISVRGGDLTVTGNGKILGVTGVAYAADVKDGGKLTIENGTVYGSFTSVYAYEGTVVINGGKFGVTNPESSSGSTRVLNCHDTDYRNGTANIVVNGGIFVDFDPANNDSEGQNTNFVSEGNESVKHGDNYYIVPEGAIAASNASELLNAAATATAGDVVYLTDDITVTETTIFNASGITVEGLGHTITYYGTADNDGVTVLQFGYGTNYCTDGVTVQNLTITGSGKGALRFNGGNSSVLNNVTVSGNWYLAVNFYGTHGAIMNNCHISSGATAKWGKATVFANEQSANQLILNNTTIDSVTVNATDKGATYANNGVKLVVNDGSSVGQLYTNFGITREFYTTNGTGTVTEFINTVDFSIHENLWGY